MALLVPACALREGSSVFVALMTAIIGGQALGAWLALRRLGEIERHLGVQILRPRLPLVGIAAAQRKRRFARPAPN